MIREIAAYEKNQVYDLWQHSLTSRNMKEMEYYFKHHFQEGSCVVVEEDGKIVSSLMSHPHVLNFNGMRLNVSQFLGVATLADYRRRGNMRELMESALDEASHNTLITFIHAFYPKLYERFGFQVVYERKSYCIYANDLVHIHPINTTQEVTAEELFQAYRRFIIHFDGTYERSISYYEHILTQVKNKTKNLIAYRDQNGEVSGYLIYEVVRNDLYVREAIYRNAMSLQRMMKKILERREYLILEVSGNEQIEKIFPLAVGKRSAYMMARINHVPLFNKLYCTNIKNAQDAYKLLRRPLWMHEFF